MTTIPMKEVAAFLLGEDSLDGYWFGERHPTSPFWWREHLRAALSAPATAPEVTLQGQVSEPVIAPKDCLWSRNGHQCCPTSPQSSQPERKHTEAEVQELMYHYVYAYDGQFEREARRILGVPKP